MTCSSGGFLGVGILSLANSPILNYLSGSQMLDGKVTCAKKAGISVSICTVFITLILCLHLQQDDGGWNKLFLLFSGILAH